MNTFRILVMAILILGIAGIAPVMADVTTVANGGTVFVGEEGLTFLNNAAAPVPAGTTLAWYAAGDTPGISAPTTTYTCQGVGNEVIAPMIFQSRTGIWYDQSTNTAVINVMMPAIDVRAYNSATAEDMTNLRVVKDNGYITFRLDSNLYEGIMSRPNYASWDCTDIKVVVVDEEGATYTALYNDGSGPATTSCLTNIAPTNSQYYLPGATISGLAFHPNWALDLPDYGTGTYTFYAQVNLNGLKDNLGTVTGVTKSEVKTLEVSKDYVKIEANKDTVLHNNDFSVTITGRPNEYYVLWVKGTSGIWYPDTAPYIKPNQNSVSVPSVLPVSNPAANAGFYQFRAGQAVAADVATTGGDCYAMVKLSSSGTRTVGFGTDETTKDQTYTIRADYYTGVAAAAPVTLVANNPTYDTAKVEVKAGDVTITTSGDSPYPVGEEIILSGTNTESDYTWLFITGQNLPNKGGSVDEPANGVNTAFFGSVNYPDGVLDSGAIWTGRNVAPDTTWEYTWNTTEADLDAGTYTIYAVSTATNKDYLDILDATYTTASIVIEEPHVTATPSAAIVAKGDPLTISGTAVFDPVGVVPLWVFGSAHMDYINQTIEENGSFEYAFTNTADLPAGDYFVVVQHPMYNNLFDIAPQEDNPAAGQTSVVRPVLDAAQADPTTGNLPSVFILEGAGSLHGSDATLALTNAMNNTDVDDTYYELTFTVEEPWIMINTIGDKHVGDRFTVTGTTNLAVGDSLNITLTHSGAATPVAAKTAIITPGITTGANLWEVAVDTVTFSPDEYVFSVKGLDITTETATQTFNLLKAEPIPPTPQTITVTLPAGWSLISTPVDNPVIAVTGSLYENAYAYNTTTDAYETVALTKILPGEGYWIGAFKDTTIEFTGVPLTEYQKSLAKEWNLLGGIGIATDIQSISITPAALSGPLYQYNPETRLYSQATALEPGQGYWASSAESCTIDVRITPPPAPA